MFILTKLKLGLAAGVVILLGFAAAYFRGASDARDRVEASRNKLRLKHQKKAKRIRDEIDQLDDTELSKRARGLLRGDDDDE